MKPGSRTPEPATPEADVLAYLQRHPDFFARNSALVEGLLVPHDCGAAHSLIEHQVSVLRRRNRQLDRQLRELVRNARHNERLSNRVHALVLGLLERDDVASLLEELYRALREDFRADLVTARLLVPVAGGLVGHPAFADDASLRSLLAELGAPRCGPLRADIASVLFGRQAPRVGSAVLVPLAVAAYPGVLAIADREPERFRPQMGTVFLEQLADVVSRLLGRLLAGQPGRPR